MTDCLCLLVGTLWLLQVSPSPPPPTTTPAPIRPTEPPRARTVDQAAIAAIATNARDEAKLPGLVLAVVPRDGSPVVAASGARAATEDAAITVDDRMHLGSCTKAFTATLAAALVADGKIQ